MGTDHLAELEGQISINELLDQPIGTEPIQLALPIHLQVPKASARPVSGRKRAAPSPRARA